MKRYAPLFALFFLYTAAFGRDAVMTKSYPTEPGKPVSVNFRDVDGDVRIEAHDRDEITLEFTKTITGRPRSGRERYFQDIRPEVVFSANRLQVEIVYPRRSSLFFLFGHSGIRVRTVLRVPAACDVTVKLVDGDVLLAGTRGRAEARTTDGDIALRGCRGDLNLRTVDGDIDVRNSEGKLNAETVDGDLRAEGRFGAVQSWSADGDVDVRFQEGSLPAADSRFRTVDGDVRIALPREMSFRLRAISGDGRIRSEARFDSVRLKKEHRLEAERGRGGTLISVETGDGDITLVDL